MVLIYILLLNSAKYYIGKSNNPEFRLEQHFRGAGSPWTKKYKPISIVDIITTCDNYDEDKYTLIYMAKYGIENVRGGSFCQINLMTQTIKHITNMINNANDRCYNCDDGGHYAKDCCKNDTIHISDITADTSSKKKFEYNFEYKPYQQRVYDMCVKTLSSQEYIIKKIGEHDEYNGRYRVNYLTNCGNLIVGDFDSTRRGSGSSSETQSNGCWYSNDFTARASMIPINGRPSGTSSGRPSGSDASVRNININLFNKNPYSDKIIKNLLKIVFKTSQPNKIRQEINAYIDMINSIET